MSRVIVTFVLDTEDPQNAEDAATIIDEIIDEIEIGESLWATGYKGIHFTDVAPGPEPSPLVEAL